MFQALTRYAEFRGRSNRWEFFTFLLFAFLFWIVMSIAGAALLAGSAVGGSFGLLPLVLHLVPPLFIVTPLMAVTFRRLHDIGLPAFWSVLGLPYLLMKAVDYVIPLLQSTDMVGPLAPSFRNTQDSWELFAYVCGGILLAMAAVPGNDAPNRFDEETAGPAPKRIRLTDPDAAPHTPVFDFGPPRDHHDEPPGGFGRRK
jgi:uncharacterized membrane protein YhaH (DUF805 family)